MLHENVTIALFLYFVQSNLGSTRYRIISLSDTLGRPRERAVTDITFLGPAHSGSYRVNVATRRRRGN